MSYIFIWKTYSWRLFIFFSIISFYVPFEEIQFQNWYLKLRISIKDSQIVFDLKS